MKIRLYSCLLILLCVSCKTSNIVKIVNSQTNEKINGRIIKIIEKRYSDIKDSQSLTNEKHIFFNSNKQVSEIIEYRTFKNLERGIFELEKMGEIQYHYNKTKLVKLIEIPNSSSTEVTTATRDDTNQFNNKDLSNFIEYSYLDDNTSNYQAFRHNKLDHKGIIIVTEKYEVKETIKYPNEGIKPVTYYKNFNEEFQLIKYRKEYYYSNELKTEDKSFSYTNNNVSSVSTTNYEIGYEYEFDNIGNWTNRIGKINGKIVEVLKREIIYK